MQRTLSLALVVLLLVAILMYAMFNFTRGARVALEKKSTTNPSDSNQIILYTSIDEPIARKVIDAFEKQSGLSVRIVTDTEATRSVGIAERLRAEKARPLAQVWWGNEVFNTVRLADEGFFEKLDLEGIDAIDPKFVDEEMRWAGVGLRVRVVARHKPEGVEFKLKPIHLSDFTQADFKGQLVMARPTAGTTGSQVAALYALWGEEKADAFFKALHANDVVLVGGNGVVVQEVSANRFTWGLTDNDDISAMISQGGTLMELIPDQDPPEGETETLGTLAIPTTVALVKRDEITDSAKKLAAFLLSKETEQRLIDENFC
ncbi:MAG TPA: substrate-binding domain-containing protein, partial [Tepidisphaeraceae bacterium]|nr:substrate-binding domain-containing protein [Tepidisphaeraceae bacterium]